MAYASYALLRELHPSNQQTHTADMITCSLLVAIVGFIIIISVSEKVQKFLGIE